MCLSDNLWQTEEREIDTEGERDWERYGERENIKQTLNNCHVDDRKNRVREKWRMIEEKQRLVPWRPAVVANNFERKVATKTSHNRNLTTQLETINFTYYPI